MDRHLIVATHPDDETLGAGGFILKKKAEGHEVFVLNVTNMDVSYGYSEKEVRERNDEINKMKEAYNLNGYYNLNLKPAGLDTYPKSELIHNIGMIFNDVKPNVLILPYYQDVHSDHKVVFETCYSCAKNFRAKYIKRIFMMETPSETDFAFFESAFKPNYFVDISNFLEKKIEIAKIYKSEILEHPFPRSEENIRAYATIRGAVIGVDSAEAFILVKGIE